MLSKPTGSIDPAAAVEVGKLGMLSPRKGHSGNGVGMLVRDDSISRIEYEGVTEGLAVNLGEISYGLVAGIETLAS